MNRSEYVSELAQDIRFGGRYFLAQPSFTVIALLTLAIGIGATTEIFSAVNAVVLRPLPLPAPERLVSVYEDYRGRPGAVSAGNYTDVKGSAPSFESLTAIQYSSFNISRNESAERVFGARVTASFFGVFGVAPALGRAFTEAEDEPGRDDVLVLSHRL